MNPCDLVPPLLGHLVALTGHRRGAELAGHLEGLGATVVRGPMLETRPMGDEPQRLRAATHDVVADPPAYLVAMTGIGMRTWLNAATSFGLGDDLRRSLRATRILARGPKVVGALSEAGLRAWRTEPSGRSDAMLETLCGERLDGVHVALQLPGSPMPAATERLRDRGARVTSIAAYDSAWPDDLAPARKVLRAIIERRASAVTFTSRPAARNFVALARHDGVEREIAAALEDAVLTVCVGETPAAVLRASFGVDAVVADRPMLGAVVQTVAGALRARGHHHLRTATGEIVVQRRFVVGGDGSTTTSDREADLLARFLAQPHRTLSRDELLASVWPGEVVDASVLETTMARLRRRLRVTGLEVRTVNGRGYLLDAEPCPCRATRATTTSV